MNAEKDTAEPSENTGVADVRQIRENIAAQYGGDLRKHIAETNRIVEPLVRELELKEGAQVRNNGRRFGTSG